jgi:MarR family transcriptional regulator for hemolysin
LEVPVSTDPSEPYDLGILLGLAYQDFVAELNAHLAQLGFDGIRPSFGYVFRALLEQDLTASMLAAQLGITAPGAGKLVEEMVAAGYVERVADPADARSRRLRLSRRGGRAVAAARRFHRQFEERLAAEHGTRAVATLRGVLEGIVGRGEKRLLRQI